MNEQLPSPDCVVRVGNGCGFIVRYASELPVLGQLLYPEHHIIVTAAHCLPSLPPADVGSIGNQLPYWNLVRDVKKKSKCVPVACIFADPVADIAVLGCPEEEFWPEETKAYDRFISNKPFLEISEPASGMGWMLGFNRNWTTTAVTVAMTDKQACLFTRRPVREMLGSPILDSTGKAIGVLVVRSDGRQGSKIHDPQPTLVDYLPARLLRVPPEPEPVVFN